MRRIALILLPCAVAVLVHLWLAQRSSSSSNPLDNNTNSDESLPFYEVLVGVLSARHHHELRQAIRKTWLGYLREHPHFQHRVGVKFIVGEHGCPIPEEDREDPYSCSLLNFTQPGPTCSEKCPSSCRVQSGTGKKETGSYLQKKNRRHVTYEMKDRVWMKAHPVSKASKNYTAKLAPRWIGPYRIVEQVGPVNYRIVREDTGKDLRVVNVCDLKECRPNSVEVEAQERETVMRIFLDSDTSDKDEFMGFL